MIVCIVTALIVLLRLLEKEKCELIPCRNNMYQITYYLEYSFLGCLFDCDSLSFYLVFALHFLSLLQMAIRWKDGIRWKAVEEQISIFLQSSFFMPYEIRAYFVAPSLASFISTLFICNIFFLANDLEWPSSKILLSQSFFFKTVTVIYLKNQIESNQVIKTCDI